MVAATLPGRFSRDVIDYAFNCYVGWLTSLAIVLCQFITRYYLISHHDDLL